MTKKEGNERVREDTFFTMEDSIEDCSMIAAEDRIRDGNHVMPVYSSLYQKPLLSLRTGSKNAPLAVSSSSSSSPTSMDGTVLTSCDNLFTSLGSQVFAAYECHEKELTYRSFIQESPPPLHSKSTIMKNKYRRESLMDDLCMFREQLSRFRHQGTGMMRKSRLS